MKNTTKQDVAMTLKTFAEDAGFRFNNDERFGFQIIDDTHTVNFTIIFDTDWSTVKNGYVDVTYKVNASIATMGGNPTGDELKEMANIIMKAGQLVNTLEIQQSGFHYLTYRQYLS